VKIGVGRNYSDVPPVRGTYRGMPERKMQVDVLVSLIDEEATTVAASVAA
jgi:transglutaminase-like putative cysteine protease